ncbi:L-glutamate gamma-semialdehyde dehydrogenase [Reichenbachiella versicolor]|uniref:L-glutamate gamma-semialdehyde dehydrogenase n=1 Tax=Reichenbachiella versicolor TaxID=1821036 RepID=UPI000D6E8053|nr:L-glutamate gamma-semialdehyde dehydrogenase [Reichenbachiella versicolor]
MSNGIFTVPAPVNEPVLDYSVGSSERESVKLEFEKQKSEVSDIPMYIGGEEVFTEEKVSINPPFEHATIIGHYNKGNASHATKAIEAATKAKKSWANMSHTDRAAIFLRAADLISGPYRDKINAATMLCQSKNIYQAEIDSACELIDFLRFNCHFMELIYADQPLSSSETWNRMDYRPLDGFVFAVTPFNFTAIAGNLPTAPAMMGNTVIWKPADSQIYSAAVIMEVLIEAGLPKGVINLVYADGPEVGDIVFNHADFAGLHFTGSTQVFKDLWKTIGSKLDVYKSYPRIVGETGGKDFILAHQSADPKAVSTAMIRGAFEFQGQKCSAASRAYIPATLWDEINKYLAEDLKTVKMGSPEDFSNFINAVIDERAFDKIEGYIEMVKSSTDAEIIFGGKCDKSIGYFIEPTVVLAKDPQFVTMKEEIFGPVLTVYIYDEKEYDKVLQLVDTTSSYALTGAIFAKDREVISYTTRELSQAAGNFYVNDKPTGAVVGQQPFGGGRASGTNDKAGSMMNLLRWTSPRNIKENFNSPIDYRYPFMG